MPKWGESIRGQQPPEAALKVVQQLFHALGRNMFDTLHKEYPDACVSMNFETNAYVPRNELHHATNTADLMTRVVVAGYDMQLFDAVRKPVTDGDALEIRKSFEDQYEALMKAVSVDEKLKPIIPALNAVKNLAEQKDILHVMEDMYDPKQHKDIKDSTPSAMPPEITEFLDRFPQREKFKREEDYYDVLAKSYIAIAQARVGHKI